MMIVMKAGATEEEIQSVVSRVEGVGARAHVSAGEEVTVIGAVGDREQPCDAIDRRTEVVAVAFVSSADMERRTYRESADCREVLGCKGALKVQRRGNRVLGSCERATERVSECFEYVSVSRGDRRAPEGVVAP